MSTRTQTAAAAIARVLRPVVRLALAFGVKYQQLDAIVRDLLIDEAARGSSGERKARVNVSQLSITTGLSRVDIKERTGAARSELPATEMSYAAKTFTLWLQEASADAALRSIPVASTQHDITFENLARKATRGNVHHRAVLSELTRLKMVVREGDQVTLLASAFVPTNDEQTMLAFLADNTRDHLNAAVSNVTSGDALYLERVVFSQGLAERDCIAAMATMRAGWNRIHGQLVNHLTQAPDQVGAEQPFRVRLGVYAYYEPWESPDDADKDDDGDDANAQASGENVR
ncbi:MAG TPA: DUF6502 family protein [Burkholderiaceae bacterium]|nr:DUF6502 family protein [Burkholderiaceae bacterium]